MISILDCAIAKGAIPGPDGSYNLDDIQDTGFPFFSGCQSCHASLGPHNAYPSKSGYIRCKECIGDLGFDTFQEFQNWMEANMGYEPSDEPGDWSPDW